MGLAYPFSALVGQDEMRLALLIAAAEPAVGGVLVFGDRGTGKSTAVRGLAKLLPKMEAIADCPFRRDPAAKDGELCADCRQRRANGALRVRKVPVPVVDLPLGATEDRIVGALNLEAALSEGVRKFEPGLLASANRGFLYIDEVNLLEDHLVDLLLDVAASGENVVEREGMSIRHPADFVLIGSGNPEEGELRPQLLDRFGLSVEVRTPADLDARIEVVRRRDAFERDPAAFARRWQSRDGKIRRQVNLARSALPAVEVPEEMLRIMANLCVQLGTDGLRGELTLARAARAVAALEGASKVTAGHLRQVAEPALRHRLRRDPLDEVGSTQRVRRAVAQLLGE